jgi:hypothetical protein
MVGSEADSLIQTCMTLIGQSFLFVALIKVTPQIADTLMAGVSLNTASGVSAMRGGAAGAAALAAGAVTAAYNAPGGAADAVSGGASAVRNAANAYSANFNTYKSQGLNSVRAGVSALGSALWTGYQASRGHQGIPNSMGARPDGPKSDAVKSQAAPASERNDSVRNEAVTHDTQKTTEAPNSEAKKQKGAKNAYSAPTPEELSKKFRNWD